VKTEREYRAYVIGSDGHFISGNEFVAADDEAASGWARQFANGHNIELWSGGRFVARLKAGHEPRSSAAQCLVAFARKVFKFLQIGNVDGATGIVNQPRCLQFNRHFRD
jgi:hypothetical protein